MARPEWDTVGDVPASKQLMKEIVTNQDSPTAGDVDIGEIFWTGSNLVAGYAASGADNKKILVEGDLVGGAGEQVPLDSAPTGVAGTVYWADGVGWDPLGWGYGPYSVVCLSTGPDVFVANASSHGTQMWPTFRNLLINAQFRINQRSDLETYDMTGVTTNGRYLWDRWLLVAKTGTQAGQFSRSQLQAGTATVPYNVDTYVRMNFGAVTGSPVYDDVLMSLQQPMRGSFPRIFGKWLNLQFWARSSTSSSITPQLKYRYTPGNSDKVSFGTGILDLTPTFTFHTLRVKVPDAWTGLGWDEDDAYISLELAMQGLDADGVDLNNTGSHTIDIANVQMEVGYYPTTFEFVAYHEDLARCARYYQLVGRGATGTNAAGPASTFDPAIFISVPLIAPTITGNAQVVGTNCGNNPGDIRIPDAAYPEEPGDTTQILLHIAVGGTYPSVKNVYFEKIWRYIEGATSLLMYFGDNNQAYGTGVNTDYDAGDNQPIGLPIACNPGVGVVVYGSYLESQESNPLGVIYDFVYVDDEINVTD